MRHFRRSKLGDVVTFEYDAAARWLEKFGEQVETGGLAGAIWSDKGMNAAAPYSEVDTADGHEASKLFGEAVGYEDEIVIHGPTTG